MPLVCPNCEKLALGKGAALPNALDCGDCGQTTPTNILPLFIVTGTSGAGKTTLVAELRSHLPELVIWDKDLLWGRSGPIEQFYNNWLRIVYSVAQGGRYNLICGTILPWDLEACDDRALVGPLHFLNLHCSDEVREQRLRARPAWRGVTNEFIEDHRKFAQWLLDNAASKFDPPMPTIDTSELPPAAVAKAVASWVMGVLNNQLTVSPNPVAASA